MASSTPALVTSGEMPAELGKVERRPHRGRQQLETGVVRKIDVKEDWNNEGQAIWVATEPKTDKPSASGSAAPTGSGPTVTASSWSTRPG